MVRIAVLVSGGGTNLQALIDAQSRGELKNGRIAAVLSSRPDAYALERAARAVAEGKCDRGIVICTTGIGISIAANKIKGIRCAHCADCLQAEMTRRHNDANMMAIGAGFTGKNMAERMVEVFLKTEFEGGRHARRVNKMMALEQE